MAAFFCTLCGRVVEVQRPTGRRNRFCNNRHKTEYHHNLNLSATQFNILYKLMDSPQELPKTNTVYRMSNQNVLRKMPLIELVEGNLYQITDTGTFFLNKRLDKD